MKVTMKYGEHSARAPLTADEHGPVGGTLAECLGGIDLTEWIR